MNDPVIDQRIIALLCVCVVFVVALLIDSYNRVINFVLGCFFIPCPLFVGDSIHKALFTSDLVGLAIFLGLIFSGNFTKVIKFFVIPEGMALLFFILALPLISTSFSFIFGVRFDYLYACVMILRILFACVAFISVVFLIVNDKVIIRDVFICGAGGYVVYLIGVALSYFNYLTTDLLLIFGTTEGFYEWNNGLGGGSMGLYRGEVGGLAALGVALIIPVFFAMNNLYSLVAPVVLGLGVLSSSYVGSRQGIIGIFFALIVHGFFVFLRGSNFLRGKFIALLVFVIGFILIVALDSPDLFYWVSERFDGMFFSSGNSPSVSLRDYRMPLIWDKLISFHVASLMGSGVGVRSSVVEQSPWVMTYVDSDYLWGLQQIGFIGYIVYLGFFLRCIYLAIIVPVDFYCKAAVVACLIVSAFFLYGHFVLMNWESSHVAAANLTLFAMAVAVGNYYRARRIQ